MKYLFLVLIGMGMMMLNGCRSTSSLPAVANFDLNRYTGTWYEAVRYPHRFEKGLSAVSAEYTINEDGTVKVLNRGFNADKGAWKEIEGVAKMKGAADEGWLKVSFFKPFYATYKIIHLDDDYTQAIVVGPSYGYLWILVRDPAFPDSELELLIQKAEQVGFDREQMLRVDQEKNLTR